MLQELKLTSEAPLDVTQLVFNLAIGVILALILRWHFKRFGSTLSNREEFAQVFPFVLLTTVLIITVVKSSLALSLGLVGALSIVRFRTPIKEPEELAYLFISIAMGLGLGANQTIPTVVAGLVILAVIGVLKFTRQEDDDKNLFLSIDWKNSENEVPENYLEQLSGVISRHANAIDLRRFDCRGNSLEVTYFIDISSTSRLNDLISEIRQKYPQIGVTFLDQNRLPSV